MANKKRTKVISVLLNEEEHARIQAYSGFKDLSLSEVLRDYIKSLPNYSNKLFTDGFF